MNYRLVLNSLGKALLVETLCFLPSLIVSWIYREDTWVAFLQVILVTAVVGGLLSFIKPKQTHFYPRDAFAVTAFAWIVLSAFGALPFVLSGSIPHYVDAFFETVSGFTTTGSTILTDVETMPKSILFWRSFTHWIGGMGVLVLVMAILPSVQGTSLHILRAESTGPSPGKVVPKMGETAKILWIIYITLSALMVTFLLAGGMPLFDTLIHTFGTAGTGGFSNRALSVGAYQNNYYTWVITIFMFLFGVNLSLYWALAKGNFKNFFKDEELRFYFFTVLIATLLITWNLRTEGFFTSIGESLTHSAFQVSTIITTTGFSTTNFDLWPVFSKTILVILMFIGASAGSTAGGIKCVRFVLIFKTIKREITRNTHPRSVATVKLNGRTVDEGIISGVMTFFALYLIIFTTALLAISLEGKDLVTSFTAVATTINNVGPGLGLVGPMGSFAEFSAASKLIFSLCMLVGRLEIFPILLLFVPSFWKKHSI